MTEYSKIKLVRYYGEKKRKNKYDPKTETVKSLELIDQSKILNDFLNAASKVYKISGHASSHLIFSATFFSKFQIFEVGN